MAEARAADELAVMAVLAEARLVLIATALIKVETERMVAAEEEVAVPTHRVIMAVAQAATEVLMAVVVAEVEHAILLFEVQAATAVPMAVVAAEATVNLMLHIITVWVVPKDNTAVTVDMAVLALL